MLKKFIFSSFSKNLATLALSSYVSLLVLNAFTSFLIDQKNQNDYFIRREKIKKNEILQKIKSVSEGYIPQFQPVNTVHLLPNLKYYPIGGLPFTKTYYCDEGYGLVKYYSDRFCLRNPDNLWDNVMTEESVFLIGDSFVNGACVENEETLASLMNKSYNLNALNVGISGNTMKEYLATLRTLINPILESSSSLKHVVVFLYANDFSVYKYDTSFTDLDFVENSTLTSSGELVYNPLAYAAHKKAIFDEFDLSQKGIYKGLEDRLNRSSLSKLTMLNNFLQLKQLRFYIRSIVKTVYLSVNTKPVDTLLSDLVDELASICTANCKPYVTYIPSLKSREYIGNQSLFIEKIISATASKNIQYIDIYSLLYENKNMYAPGGPHLTPNGYAMVSNKVSQSLQR